MVAQHEHLRVVLRGVALAVAIVTLVTFVVFPVLAAAAVAVGEFGTHEVLNVALAARHHAKHGHQQPRTQHCCDVSD